jgi:hypothetical protein
VTDLRYDRLYRTPSSEAYLISDGDQPLARLELHFATTAVYGLLLFDRDPGDKQVREVIARVDEDLVWTASVPRDDFVVSVYAGREVGVYDDTARGEDSNGASGGGDGGYG